MSFFLCLVYLFIMQKYVSFCKKQEILFKNDIFMNRLF